MKNKFLISLLTLVVFFNFTIPNYVLAAPERSKNFSRNIKAQDANKSSQKALEPISAYSYPLLQAFEIPEYVLPGEKMEASRKPGLRNGSANLSLKKKAPEKEYLPDKFFVKFKDLPEDLGSMEKLSVEEIFLRTPELAEIAQSHGINFKSSRREFTALINFSEENIRKAASLLRNIFLVRAETKEAEEFIKALMNTGTVEYAERVPANMAFSSPDDPMRIEQWHLTRVQSLPAWDIYNAHANSDVVIAIVDDGVKIEHEDLAGNIWVNIGEIPNNGIDDDNNGYIDDIHGYDVAMNDNDPNPPSTATNNYFMHGTHVAGIAAAVSNNTIGISSLSGACQNKVKIMAVKTKEDYSPGGSLEATLEGLQYAIAAGANVINMSWGSYVYSQTYQNLFIMTHSLGISCVAAAGNENTFSYAFPASYEYVISVGAVDQNDQKAVFSNYNDLVDVMSPGVDILSTLPLLNNSYGSFSGTSMASPLVAGLVGMALSYNNTLTPHQVELLLEENCNNINSLNPNYIGQMGAGRINAYKVMQDLQAGTLPSATEIFTSISTDFIGAATGHTAWGDYDNDGNKDILILGALTGPKLYHNNGNGTFSSVAVNFAAITNGSAAWGDYDNDGYLDVFLIGHGAQSLSGVIKVYHNNANGTFSDINAALPAIQDRADMALGDYDNDGRLDIAYCSQSGTQILRNNGNGTFTNINAGFPGVWGGTVAWGDYNKDGRLDLLLTGSPYLGGLSYGPKISRIYHNNGNGVFTDINAGLIGINDGSAAWGDYDNDGDLDILLSGYVDSGSPTGAISKIYKNNNNGTFADSGINLPYIASHWHGIAWADYDNDGRLDIIFSGRTNNTDFKAIAKVYHNNGGNNFSEILTDLVRLDESSVAWGDYDNDGYLDLIMSGIAYESTGFDGTRVTHLYHNNLSGNPNAVPVAPTGLNATVNGQSVVLSWQKATDSKTPQNGLSYNLFVGTSPNAINIQSPMSQVPNGLRRVVTMGSQNENTSWTIDNLQLGTYYWGVQSIDTGFAGSAFATGSFTVTQGGGSGPYTISGNISTPNGTPLPGVTLTVAPNPPASLPMTDANGNYSFVMPAGWTGTATPSLPGYSFSPSSINYPPLAGNFLGQNYIGTFITYSISGQVTVEGTTNGLSGVTMTASNNGGTTTTAIDGTYTFANLPPGWSGTVTPSKENYNFSPQEKSYTNLSANQIDQDFSGSFVIYTISGMTITMNGNYPIAGVEIKEGTTVLATSNTDGFYSFSKPHGWSGTVYASKAGYIFSPVHYTYNNLQANANSQVFYGVNSTQGVYIVGHVYSGGIPLDGVKLTASDGTQVTSHNGGSYYFVKAPGWSGTVMPSKAGYIFTPPVRTYTNIIEDQLDQDYSGVIGGSYTISGTITKSDGTPLAGVTLHPSSNAPTPLPVTDANGQYSFSMPNGWLGSVTPVKTGYYFSPQNKVYSYLGSNQTNQNYVAYNGTTYSISGKITLAGTTTGLEGVSIIATNGGGFTMTTADGTYTLYSIESGWTGTVTPHKEGYALSPESKFYNNLNSNQSNQNYIASVITYGVSGYVRNASNQGISGVDMKIDNATVATTDANGYYAFIRNYGWSGTVIPSKIGYAFLPESRTYVNIGGNLSDQNYNGTLQIYTIQGVVSDGALALSGVDLKDSNNNVLATTGPGGEYILTKPHGWSDTVTPSKPGYSFSPASRTYTNLSGHYVGHNYTPALNGDHTISGLVTLNGLPLSGVEIKDASNILLALTAEDGTYSFTKPSGWSGTVAPFKPGHNFTPSSKSYVNLSQNQSSQNYTASLESYLVSGSVMKGGDPLSGVQIKDGGGMVLATTNAQGFYSFTKPYGWSATVSASKFGYTFTPVNRVYAGLSANQPSQDYEGALISVAISGVVTENNVPVPGVIIEGTGGIVLATTNSSGVYSFTKDYGWSGTVQPHFNPEKYNFTPVDRIYNNVTANQINQNYAATLKTFNITGQVSGLLANNSYPVTITAIGTNGSSTVTADATNGSYSLTLPYGWTGSLLASSVAYDLTEAPAITFAAPVTSDQTQDYVATLKTFSITGNISGLLSNNPYPVIITASGPPNFSVIVTGPNYVINNVPYGWAGSLNAVSVAYDLVPTFIVVPFVAGNVTAQDFSATLKTFTLSGDIAGLIPGTNYPVTIEAQASGGYSTVTADASSGHYAMTLPYGWTGILSAISPAYDIVENPTVTFITPATQDQVQDYDAKLKKFTVSGSILDLNPGVNEPITITANCSNPGFYQNITADATSGSYAMTLPYGWEGALTASSAAYVFIEDPGVTFSSPVTQDQVQDYRAKIKMFSVSGTVYQNSTGNPPLAGAQLNVKGLGTWANYQQIALTNDQGYYSFEVPYGFSGSAVASKSGYAFTPLSRSYANMTTSIAGHHYLAIASLPVAQYNISGYIRTPNGQAVSGVSILAKDLATGQTAVVAVTNAMGYYRFTKSRNWSGRVTPSQANRKFDPAYKEYISLQGNQVQDYIRVQ